MNPFGLIPQIVITFHQLNPAGTQPDAEKTEAKASENDL